MRFSDRLAILALIAVAAVACKDSSTVRGGLGRTGVASGRGIQKVTELAWKSDVDSFGSVLLVSGDVWVPTRKKLVHLSDDSGEEVEHVELPAVASPAMTIASGVAYWGSGHRVVAANVDDGEELWSSKTKSAVQTAVAVSDELVLAGGGTLHAFERVSGEEQWTFEGEGEIDGAPSFVDDQAFVTDSSGRIYAVDAATGQQSWVFEGPAGFDPVSVAVDGAVAVAGDSRGVVWAVFADRGREKWRFPTGGVVSSSVAIHDDRVFVGNEAGVVLAINARTGQEVWRTDELAAVTTAPVVAGGLVYVGCDDGRLLALDEETGEVAWEFELEDEPVAAPTIGNGTIWVTDHSGQVYAIE